MEFAQVPVQQFVPPLNFFPVETEIIDVEIFKVLSKCVIVNTTREPNDYVSSIRGPKKIVIMEWYLTWKHSLNFWNLSTANKSQSKMHLTLIMEGCYFGSVHLKDASYRIPIHDN